MCADAVAFCAEETAVGACAGLAGRASCAKALVVRANSPAAKEKTIFIVKIPLRSVPKRRIFVQGEYGNRTADFRAMEEREEKSKKKREKEQKLRRKRVRDGRQRA